MSPVVRFGAFFLLVVLVELTALAQPHIDSFSPTFGASTDNQFITIIGSGFAPGTLVVRYNGVQDTTAAATGSMMIQSRVPSGAPLGPGPIYVSVNGVPTQSTSNFTVIGPGPYITGCSPNTGGSGTPVTITGVHFTGVNSVTFAGQPGTSLFVQSDTSIKVNAPTGVTSGPIVVTGPQGSATNSSDFYVSPVITGFAPSSGRTGTNLLVRGVNLLGASSVVFAGTGGAFTLSVTPNVLSNRALNVTIPTNAVTGLFRVIAPAGSVDTTSNFVVQPTIYGFSPGFGAVGSSVTITGANFNVGTPVVRFGGVASPSVTGVSFGQLTATVPSTTNGPITVTTTAGTSTSANLFYLPPSISSFSPSKGAVGTLVTINGVNFLNASSVTFSNAPPQAPFVTNNTTIGVAVPAGVLTGPVSVTTPGGTATSSGLFYGAPGITSFNPTHGLPGTLVSLTGTNLLGATNVQFGGVVAQTIYPTNNTSLGALVPNGAVTGPITIITPGGTNTTAGTFVLDYTSDMSVTLGDAPDPVVAGSNLVYSITVLNNTAFAAPNVMVTNTLPPLVILQSATTSRGSLTTNTPSVITGNLSTITNGFPVTITLTVVPISGGLITNTVSVGSDYPDPVPANNTASTVTTVIPRLQVLSTPTNAVLVRWPAPSTGFKLQQNLLLGTTNWTGVTNGVTSVMATGSVITNQNQVIVSTQNTNQFFRLKYP